MQKGNVNGALKIITNNVSGLPLTAETLQLLELKHPDAKNNHPTGDTTRTNTKNAPNCA